MDINMQSPMPQPEHDDEGKMAKADLYKTAKYSLKLFKMMEDNAQLEGWVQAKITKAADYLASVYHYLEYEMKFTEYGRAIEDSEMYTESEKRILKKKLFEAKEKVKDLKKAQAEKIKAKDKKKIKENRMGAGGIEGIIQHFAKEVEKFKKTGEMDYNLESALWDHFWHEGEIRNPDADASEFITNRFQQELDDMGEFDDAPSHHWPSHGGVGENASDIADIHGDITSRGVKPKRKIAPGVDSPFDEFEPKKGHKRITRRSDSPASGKDAEGDAPVTSLFPGHDERAAKFLAKQVHGRRVSPMDQLTKRKGMTDDEVSEAQKSKKAKKDYDGDGEVESGKDEVIGSRRKAAGLPFKEASEKKCNHTPKGKSCPVHGMKECSGMMEAKPSAGMSKGEKSAVVKKAQAGKDIGKPGKSFDKVAKAAGGGEKGKKIAAAAMWKNQAK